jgi:hypothetical protein
MIEVLALPKRGEPSHLWDSRCIMELREQVEKIQTRDDFVLFIYHLVRDLRTCPERWENTGLEAYLAAIAAWVQEMESYYRNRGETAPQHHTWKQVWEILLAARIYE